MSALSQLTIGFDQTPNLNSILNSDSDFIQIKYHDSAKKESIGWARENAFNDTAGVLRTISHRSVPTAKPTDMPTR